MEIKRINYLINSAIKQSFVRLYRNFSRPFLRTAYGFTLIELLVVISIIGLLASVVLVNLNSARAKSRDAKRIADMGQLSKAMELYYNEYNSYPTATMDSTVLGTNAVPVNVAKYITRFPIAPRPADGGCIDGNPSGPGTNYNAYYYQSNGLNYTITFCVGTNVPSGIHTGTSYMTPGGFR